jgi:hypothetical protein
MQYNLTAIGATVWIASSTSGAVAARVVIGGLSADLLATVKDKSSATLICYVKGPYRPCRALRDPSLEKGAIKDPVLATPIEDIAAFDLMTSYADYPYVADKTFTNYENLSFNGDVGLNSVYAPVQVDHTFHGCSNGQYVNTQPITQFTSTGTKIPMAFFPNNTVKAFVPNHRASYNSMTANDNYLYFTADDYFCPWYYSKCSYDAYDIGSIPLGTYNYPIGGLMLYTNGGNTLYIAGRNEIHLTNSSKECWSRQTDRGGRPLVFPPGKYYVTALSRSHNNPYIFITAMFLQKCLEPPRR